MVDEDLVLSQGLERLRGILGNGWQVEPVSRPAHLGLPVAAAAPPGEQVVNLAPPPGTGANAWILVEARQDLSPQQAGNEFQAKVALMRNLIGTAAVLVVAPWLSPRTRGVLEELGYNYLDLTGNVSLRLHQPAVIVRTEGERENPSRSGRRAHQQLRGGTAGRLVRVLVDAAPPYRAAELANASGVSISYVSRLLDALEDEALIAREGRLVVRVDWQQLIRARASQYGLLNVNPYVPMLAQRGPDAVLDRLRDKAAAIRRIGPVAVTGTFAAMQVIREEAAIGGQLMIYVPADPRQSGPLERVAESLGLLRSESYADVLLIRAMNPVVFERIAEVEGIPCVALSQLAIDSLGGTGRMPSDGEALLGHMARNVPLWRAPSLRALSR